MTQILSVFFENAVEVADPPVIAEAVGEIKKYKKFMNDIRSGAKHNTNKNIGAKLYGISKVACAQRIGFHLSRRIRTFSDICSKTIVEMQKSEHRGTTIYVIDNLLGSEGIPIFDSIYGCAKIADQLERIKFYRLKMCSEKVLVFDIESSAS